MVAKNRWLKERRAATAVKLAEAEVIGHFADGTAIIKYNVQDVRHRVRGERYAAHSGQCPLCPKYIRKPVSRIAPIPEEWQDWAFTSGMAVRGRRLWAHADCVRRLQEGKEPPFYPGGNAGMDDDELV